MSVTLHLKGSIRTDCTQQKESTYKWDLDYSLIQSISTVSKSTYNLLRVLTSNHSTYFLVNTAIMVYLSQHLLLEDCFLRSLTTMYFHMGSGMFTSHYVFTKRLSKNCMFGFDLRFDDVNSSLGIFLRYCEEKVSKNLTLSDIVTQQLQTEETCSGCGCNVLQKCEYEESNHDFTSTIKENAVFNLGTTTYKVMDNYGPLCTSVRCVVTSSMDDNISVNYVHEMTYEVVHT